MRLKMFLQSTQKHQVHFDDADPDLTGLYTLFVIGSVFTVIIMAGSIYRICKKDQSNFGPGYSVAISNRLFKVSQIESV